MDLKLASKAFINFDTFYLLGSYRSHRVFRGNMEVNADEADALTRGELTPRNPVVVRHYMGATTPGSVIWTGFVAPIIFHRRITDTLVAKGFSGWSSYPVIVYGKNDEVFSDYSGLAFKGRCGPIDDSLSEVVQREFPSGKFPVLKGMFFDPESWDGCDFFMSSDKGLYQFVTRRVKNCLVRAKVSSLEFDSLTEVERDTGWKVSK